MKKYITTINYHSLLSLIFVLSFYNHSQANFGRSCGSVFSSYWQGTKQFSSKSFDVFVLGAGEMGGTVRRVVNKKTKESILEKEYYEPDGLFNDVGALKVLGKLAASEPMVKIRQPKKIKEDEILYFDDVRGFALDRLSETDFNIKLKKEFLYWAYKVFERAKKTTNMETNILDSGSFWMSYRVPLEERKDFYGLSVIDIILKPDNVIYDTDLKQMIIFDPY